MLTTLARRPVLNPADSRMKGSSSKPTMQTRQTAINASENEVKQQQQFCGVPGCKEKDISGQLYFVCENCSENVHLNCSSYIKSNLNSSILKLCDGCTTTMRKALTEKVKLPIVDLCDRVQALEKVCSDLLKLTQKQQSQTETNPVASTSSSTKFTHSQLPASSLVKSKQSQSTFQNKSNMINIAKQTKQVSQPKIEHQIILNPKEKSDTYADKLKMSLKNIPVKNHKVMNDGTEIINFPSKAYRDQALDCLSEFDPKAEDRNQRQISPKITIFGLSREEYNENSTNSATRLLEAIINKNPKIKQLTEDGKLFEILFIKQDPFKEHFSRAIVKVDNEILSSIRQNSYRLFVDFSSCHVSDRVHIIQCYRCQKYGHTKDSETCSLFGTEDVICMYCSGNHFSKNCEKKANKNTQGYKCSNCIHANKRGTNTYDVTHATTSSKCQLRQRQIEKVIDRTIGFEGLSKNSLRQNAIVT